MDNSQSGDRASFLIAMIFVRLIHATAAISLLLWPGGLSAASTSSQRTIDHVEAAIGAHRWARGVHGQTLAESEMKGVILSMTPPDYPIEARHARLTGSGVFEMRIDSKSGRVKGVLVVQSTGRQILDWAVARAFSQWRFKPGLVTAVRSPVTFAMTGFR